MTGVQTCALPIWWYNRTRQPGLILDDFTDPWLDRVRLRNAELGRELWALDLTTDLGVPVVVALSAGDGLASGPVLGFGAHFDPRVALRRAATELCQQLGAQPNSSRASRLHDYLRPSRAAATSPLTHPYERCVDLREDVDRAVTLLRSANLELLAIDQTRPDVGMPVAKVLVPGLRPIRARFAPGRLYDVPVRLGRLSRPTCHRDLNPAPLSV